MHVPIVIDSVKDFPSFKMTRCSYFAIENSDIGDLWRLRNSESYVAFLMIGLEGVVCSPVGDTKLFDSVDKIEEFFNEIETYRNLSIEINHIWVPNTVFRLEIDDLFRGQVFRVSAELFNVLFHYGDESATHEELLDHIRNNNLTPFAELSTEETDALHQWNNREIMKIQNHYHASDKRLSKKNDLQHPDPFLKM